MNIGFLIFPEMTQLDMTGPYEVFEKFPDSAVDLIWKDLSPVTVGGGMRILPTIAYDTCPELDILCIPGGLGVNALLNDAETLDFVRARSRAARYVTSVCTGALVLGAAGLLKGRRATTHWMSHDLLEAFGAVPVKERVVVDGNLITGGGVTAGIDFALVLAAEILGEQEAMRIQLAIEYDPKPPFDAGSPETAGAALVERVRILAKVRQDERIAEVEKAALALSGPTGRA
jgi:cyclohexyl-isocyanide hydratase